MPAPSALVTCGPAYAEIDSVRRITNQSTGELGAMLCQTLVDAGFAVTCLRGEMATHPRPAHCTVRDFSTNLSLEQVLETLPAPNAIFHAAALCDFELAAFPGKISSNTPSLHLDLQPAPKILPLLRPLFPDAIIVGWKFEVDGSREDALQKGRHQIVAGETNACVVNGPAYGTGLAILERDSLRHYDTRPELCTALTQWTLSRLAPPDENAPSDPR